MVRLLNVGMVLFAAVVVMPSFATRVSAQSGQAAASEEDPNDKTAIERDFEATRKHMQHHSNWSKKSGKMNDN